MVEEKSWYLEQISERGCEDEKVRDKKKSDRPTMTEWKGDSRFAQLTNNSGTLSRDVISNKMCTIYNLDRDKSRENNRQLTFNDTIDWTGATNNAKKTENNFTSLTLRIQLHFALKWMKCCWVLFTEITQYPTTLRQMNNFMIRRINPNCITSWIFSVATASSVADGEAKIQIM